MCTVFPTPRPFNARLRVFRRARSLKSTSLSSMVVEAHIRISIMHYLTLWFTNEYQSLLLIIYFLPTSTAVSQLRNEDPTRDPLQNP